MKLNYSWTTKNHNSRCQGSDKASTGDGYIPGSSLRRGDPKAVPEEVVMQCIREFLDGGKVKEISVRHGLSYDLVYQWCKGETKYPLYCRVLKERGQ